MVIKIGHRGAAGYEPENTLLSFKKAIELNVDMIELDVYICKTGEIVIIHDDKLDRTTNGKGYVVKKYFNQLRKLNAGKGEKIPTLKEVLDLINKKTKINIELKGPGTAKPVHKLIKNYIKNKKWKHNDFIISSFDHNELKKFNELNPKIKIGILFEEIQKDSIDLAKKMGAYSINIPLKFTTQEFINNAHKKRLKVYTYTANKSADIKKIKSFGIDGIFSNFPDKI